MNRKILAMMLSLIVVMICTNVAFATTRGFVPKTQIMKLSDIKIGMTGYAHTVLKGEEISRFKIKIVDIFDKTSAPEQLILFKVLDKDIIAKGGVVAGMSGSPIYINGKLIGAIGYGWGFTDGSLGMATPIESMIKAMDWEDKLPVFYKKSELYTVPDKEIDIKGIGKKKIKPLASPIFVSGLSPRTSKFLGRHLNANVKFLGGKSNNRPTKVDLNAFPKPGSSIGVALMWGDVSAGGIGTLSAVSTDCKFLAFAHPMLNRGSVAIPFTRARIMELIPSLDTPFKLGTITDIIGVVTQDRPEAIGGHLGQLVPASTFKVVINDLDNHRSVVKNFSTVTDPFMAPALATAGIVGCIENEWNRSGQGTVSMDIDVDGANMKHIWHRHDVFFSDNDAVSSVFEEIKGITKAFMQNGYGEIAPIGITVKIDITSDPVVTAIQNIAVVDEKPFYAPGEEVQLEVTLRPWREKSYKRTMAVRIPKTAIGICEFRVRGGDNSGRMYQDKREFSTVAVKSFDEMLKEMSAIEANDMLIAEVHADKMPPNAQIQMGLLPEEFTDNRLGYIKLADEIKNGTRVVVEEDGCIVGDLSKFVKIKRDDPENKKRK